MKNEKKGQGENKKEEGEKEGGEKKKEIKKAKFLYPSN